VLASYDVINIISGKGMVRLYGTRLGAAGIGPTYLLTPNQTNADITLLQFNIPVNPAWAKVAEYDFKTQVFNATATIEGDLIIENSIGANNSSANPVDLRTVFIVEKRNSAGGLLSTLVSKTTTADTFIATTTESINKTTNITIPKTTFKKGEVLHINAAIEANGTTTGGITAIGTDPFDNDETIIQPSSQTSTHTSFIVNIPFKIDL